MIQIIRMSELEEGTAVAAQAEGVELVVVKCNGRVSILEGRCPHQGAMLADGSVENGELVCSGHRWRFDCLTGEKLNNPKTCLKTFSARIEGDQVLVSEQEVIDWKRAVQKKATVDPARHAGRSLKDIPGPKGIPLLGNLLQLDLNRLHLVLEKWCEEFGPIYTIDLPHKPALVIADPELINNILRERPETYRRVGSIEPIFKEMGINGVFSAEGESWRRQRRLTMQALSTNHLRQFFEILIKVTNRLKKRWDSAASSRQVVEAQKDLMRYTVDVTTNLAFGYDINTLEKEGDLIQRDLEKIFPTLNRRVMGIFPYWRYFKLPSDYAVDRALCSVHRAIEGFVKQGRERLARNPELALRPTNLLESMLVARDEEDSHFTDDEIFGNVFTMLLAGEDTTANTMAWMMHFMAEYPEIQSRMQEEADQVLCDSETPDNFQNADKLRYIEAVAHETMRLKPVAPVLTLEPNEDVTIGGVDIPKHTMLMLPTRYGVMQESNFTAADKFQPERWLDSNPRQPAHNTKAFVPFGAGPRFCPGRNLAMLEIKMVMAMVCHNFSVSKSESARPIGERFAFTMMPEDLFINFSARLSDSFII